jgi:hypothetical protein
MLKYNNEENLKFVYKKVTNQLNQNKDNYVNE